MTTVHGWPRLMDRQTAGEYLSVSEWVIRQYRDSGDLPVVKVRSMERFDRRDLDSLADRLAGAAPAPLGVMPLDS